MTYQEFIDNFVKTDKTFMAYQQGRYLVRVVKIPLAAHVQALYASFTFRPEKSKATYGFESGKRMEIVGFVDCHGALRFPTFGFIHDMVDDGQNVQKEDKNAIFAQAVQVAVDKLALATPLPACPNEDYAYRQAYEAVFSERTSRPNWLCNDFSSYINDNTLVAYLANAPEWAEDVAQKWASDYGGRVDDEDKTKLDVYRGNLAIEQKMREFAESIKADKNNPIHNYIAMKKAVEEKNAKTVTVTYKTKHGDTDDTRISAAAFCKGGDVCISQISLYEITPCHESDRVAKLLPKVRMKSGCEYDADYLPKDRIVAIKYAGKTIWTKESQDAGVADEKT